MGKAELPEANPLYLGGVEAFLGAWEDVLEKLTDVGQAPNDFLERTLLKAAIVNEEYQGVITNLDMRNPPPTPSECKSKIWHKGAKLEAARGNKAVRMVRYTLRWDIHEHHHDALWGFQRSRG